MVGRFVWVEAVASPVIHQSFVCLFVFGFYGPVNSEVMSSRSVNSGTVPGQS